jgi:hypothetical protein
MPDNFPISVTTKNLFLTLAESVAQTLNVTLFYVSRGANIGDYWPWEARELDPGGLSMKVPSMTQGRCLAP